MEDEQHPLNLGKLLVNFQSLEFVLRAFLLKVENSLEKSFHQSQNLLELNEGAEVPENAFTNYDTLGQLIDKYNSHPKVKSLGLTIDRSVIDIRDAISHGRVLSLKPTPPFNLLKFDRPQNNRTKVTFNILLTREWFSEQLPRVQRAAITVAQAREKL